MAYPAPSRASSGTCTARPYCIVSISAQTTRNLSKIFFRAAGLKERRGIESLSIFPDLEVHMGASGPPGAPHRGNRLSLADGGPNGHEVLSIVGIEGRIALGVFNDDHIAIPSLRTTEDHLPGSGGAHRRAGRGRNVHAS